MSWLSLFRKAEPIKPVATEVVPTHGTWDQYETCQNPDEIIQQFGYQKYRSMATAQPEILNAIDEVILQVLADPWDIRPASDEPRDIEIAEEIKQMILQLGADEWDGKLVFQTGEGLFYSILYAGRVDGTYVGDPVTWRRPDGKIWLDHVKEKDISIFAPGPDEFGNLEGLQYNIDGDTRPVDPRDLIIWPFYARFNDFYGRTNMKSIFRASWLIHLCRKLVGIKAQKETYGQPVAFVPEGKWRAQEARIISMLKKLTIEGVACLPEYVRLDKYDLTASGGKSGLEMITKIWDMAINEVRIAIMGGTLQTGESKHGTRAQAETHADRPRIRADFDRAQLVSVVNRQIIQRICNWNYYTDQKGWQYPRFVIESAKRIDREKEIKTWFSAWSMGAKLSLKQLQETFSFDPPEGDDDTLSMLDLRAAGAPILGPGGGKAGGIEAVVEPDKQQMSAFKAQPSREHIRSRAIQRRISKKAWKDLDEATEEAIADLSGTVKQINTGVVKYLDKNFVDLQKNPDVTWRMTITAKSKLNKSILSLMDQAAGIGNDAAVVTIQSLTEIYGTSKFAAPTFDKTYIAKLRKQFAKWYGDRFTVDVESDLAKIILDGLNGGKTAAEIVYDLNQYTEPMVQAGTMERPPRLENLVRTATTWAFNSAKMSVMNGVESIQGFELYNPGDDRTTENICLPLIGKTWKKGDPKIIVPPLHYRCRSELFAIWWNAKDWMNPPPAGAKPAVGFGG